MAGFAPTFEGSMGIEQPIAAPTSGLGTAIDVMNIFAKNAPSTSTRAPSEDERNAALWTSTMGDVDFASASVGDLQKFQRIHPSAGAWAYTQAEGVRNQNLEAYDESISTEQKIDASWAQSPAGQRASMQAAQLDDPAKVATLLAQERAKYIENAARSEELTQETQQYGVNDARREEMWKLEAYDLTAGTDIVSTAFTDAIESMQLNPGSSINLDDTGITAQIPQLAGTVMTSSNAPEVLKAFRAAYKDVQTKRIAGVRGITPGEVGVMPSDVESAVFGRMDTLITWAEKELDPATIKSRLENTAFNAMVEAGVPLEAIASISMATKGNPELQAAVMSSLTGDVGNLLELYKGGSFEEARVAARDLSAKERTRSFAGFSELAKVWGGTSTTGSVYEEVNQVERDLNFGSATMAAMDVATTDAEASGKPVRFGPNFYRNNVEAVASNFDAAAAANPQFAPAVVKSLSSDLNMQMQETNQKANAEGYRISTDTSGKVFLAPTDETLSRIAELEAEISLAEKQEQAPAGEVSRGFVTKETIISPLIQEIEDLKTPPSIPLDDIQYKWSVLGNLGKVGSEVRAIAGASFNLEVDAGVAKEAKAALAETTTTETAVANGSVANSLGIDFGSMESEAGLPSGFLERTAQIESAGNPAAKNPKSSAGGLFQQIDENAKEFGVADRFDPIQSTEGAIKFALQNKRILSRALGRDPTAAELYLAHQQGGGGAKALLSNPDERALSVLTGLYKGNEGRARDAIRNNGGSLDMTAGQFANIWINKFNKGGFAPGSPQVTTTELGEKTSAPATSVRPEARPVGVGSSASAPTTSIRPEARATSEGEATAQPTEERPLFKGAAIPTVSATPSTDKNVMAFLESLGSSPDSTYTMGSVADVDAAKAAGALKAGDRVLITGDGAPYLVEVE